LPLPATIPVKVSSEAAGYISAAAVVGRQMAPAELIEQILRATGKDAGRVRAVLENGTVVSGAYRLRWIPIQASPEDVAEALRRFPDALPDRPFEPSLCVRAALSGGRAAIDLTRQSASRKRWFARRSFWQALMEAAQQIPLAYQYYSYADRADVYHAELGPEQTRLLRGQAVLLRYSALEKAVREDSYRRLALWVERTTTSGS